MSGYTLTIVKGKGNKEKIFSQKIKSISIVFKQTMKRTTMDIGTKKSKDWDGTEHEIDIESLSLEDVRRSKIIYLLSKEYYTVEMVKQMLDKTQSNDILWMNRLAKIIYGSGKSM